MRHFISIALATTSLACAKKDDNKPENQVSAWDLARGEVARCTNQND